jgi:hypothetical protein
MYFPETGLYSTITHLMQKQAAKMIVMTKIYQEKKKKPFLVEQN